jgi:Endonuclease/Exonuclease/phosphatase family
MYQLNYPYDDSPVTAADVMSRCKLYDYTAFNGSLFHYCFSVIHLNIRSALSKIDSLGVWLGKLVCKPAVLCLSETWSQVMSPIVTLPGYNVVSVPRASRKCGGVCMYVSSDIKFVSLSVPGTFVTFECLTLMIEASDRPIVCVVIYRPPSSPLHEFQIELSTFLDNLMKLQNGKPADYFFAGDFNIDLLSSNSAEFADLLLVANLYPTIYFPTRITKCSSTLIDNIFTNCVSQWLSGVLDCDLSDHQMDIHIC